MLNWFKARGANARKSKELYGAVVAAARQPHFFSAYGVPDTLNGRYEMIVIVLFQLLERLKSETGTLQEISRQTLESFFTDMDDNMREIGVGDLSVPKKVKKAAAGFYERTRAYRAALDARDRDALTRSLKEFIDGDDVISTSTPGMAAGGMPDAPAAGEPGKVDAGSDTETRYAALARHMMLQRDHLDAATIDDVLHGRAFLQPD